MKNKFLKNNKDTILLTLTVILALSMFMGAQTAFAAPVNSNTFSQGLNEMYGEILKIIVIVINVLGRIIWPVLLLIGSLLKNDILFSAGMEETMLGLWVTMRNFVNVIFVLVLLGIAFYNVVGGSAEDYHLNKILPKFVIALIAVNFSFLGVKVLADSVNVMTIAIFSMPGAVSNYISADKKDNWEQNVCQNIYGKEAPPASTPKPGETPDYTLCTKENDTWKFNDNGQKFFAKYDVNNAAIVMAANTASLTDYEKIVKDLTGVPIDKLLINSLFTAIMYIVFATAFVALFIVLLVRLVLLFVAIIISPLIVLKYVLPESIAGSIGGDLTKKFMKTVIAPLPIALMMTIGFMMFQTLKNAKFPNTPLSSASTSVQLLTSGLSTLQDLIIALGVVVVVWMGVFSATKDTFAEGIVNGIEGAVKGAGKFIATAPFKYLPIIPIRKGAKGQGPVQNFAPATVLGAIASMPEAMRQRANAEQREFSKAMGLPGVTTGEDLRTAKGGTEIANAINNLRASEISERHQKDLAEGLKKPGNEAALKYIMEKAGYADKNKFLTDLEKGQVEKAKLSDALISFAQKNSVTVSPEQQSVIDTAGNSNSPTANALEGNLLGAVRGKGVVSDQKQVMDGQKETYDKLGKAIGKLNQTLDSKPGQDADDNARLQFINNNKAEVKSTIAASGAAKDDADAEKRANAFLLAAATQDMDPQKRAAFLAAHKKDYDPGSYMTAPVGHAAAPKNTTPVDLGDIDQPAPAPNK